MKQHISLVFFLFLSLVFHAQDNLPTDYLTREFHAGRRAALRELMPPNSVFIVLAYPERKFSNDVTYNYHPNPDMYYFSGYREPNSLLVVFKDEQVGSDGEKFNEILFVQKRNERAEQWTGRRLGVEGAKEKLGFKQSFESGAFKDFAIDFTKFEKIIMDRPPEDLGDDPRNNDDLFDLIKHLNSRMTLSAGMKEEKKPDFRLYRELTGRLREIKTPEELNLLRKAVEISCQGQNEVMKTVHPGMSEMEVQGLHEFVHKKYGAEYIGYPSIVGAGNNGCVLHYSENTKTKIGNDLLLMDVGAEYHGYTADVTRTIPANGKFSPEQKIIYNLVYEAQEAAFRLLKEGSKWVDVSNAAREVIADGLLKLGIIKDRKEVGRYYPHGLGHHIGLDVHDRSVSAGFKKGMVITIEPGIYIPPNSNCDKKWWSIAVRIEDDALVTENGYELLSIHAPRKVEDIERKIAENSALDNFVLPTLKSAEKKAF